MLTGLELPGLTGLEKHSKCLSPRLLPENCLFIQYMQKEELQKRVVPALELPYTKLSVRHLLTLTNLAVLASGLDVIMWFRVSAFAQQTTICSLGCTNLFAIRTQQEDDNFGLTCHFPNTGIVHSIK